MIDFIAHNFNFLLSQLYHNSHVNFYFFDIIMFAINFDLS